MTSRYLEQVVLGENRGLLSWLVRVALWPLSMFYRIGLWVYLFVYRIGLRKRCKLGVPVVSIGNLTFGGTGKTPAVQTLCRMLLEQGKRVVVLSRGHGGTARGAVIVSDGENILSNSAEAGDEPVLLARTLPGVPIVVGKDRRISGRLASERFSPDVIVLDDGLQYWQLYRDMDIVVLDARKPFGSGFVMPMGDLREPISGLRRAGIVLLSNSRSISNADYESLAKRISKLAPRAKIFRCAHEAVLFKNIETGEEVDLTWARKRDILAFCGIGKPLAFFDMLEGLGASVSRSMIFPDHHRLSDRDISSIIDEAAVCNAEAIVTTEKDIARFALNGRLCCGNAWETESLCCGNAGKAKPNDFRADKFPQHTRHIPNLYALIIQLEIEDSGSFAQYVTNRING